MDLLPEGPSQKKPVILPCYKKPNLKKKKPNLKKKNAATVLCCLSMWKCNVRRGLNHQRTQIKEEK